MTHKFIQVSITGEAGAGKCLLSKLIIKALTDAGVNPLQVRPVTGVGVDDIAIALTNTDRDLIVAYLAGSKDNV